jgi:hypothetical protein
MNAYTGEIIEWKWYRLLSILGLVTGVCNRNPLRVTLGMLGIYERRRYMHAIISCCGTSISFIVYVTLQ